MAEDTVLWRGPVNTVMTSGFHKIRRNCGIGSEKTSCHTYLLARRQLPTQNESRSQRRVSKKNDAACFKVLY